MKSGIRAVIFRDVYRAGHGIQLTKYEDNQKYRVDPNSIQWIKTSEGSILEPISVNSVENFDSIDKEGSLYGENQALKNEVQFLREQIAKLLEKK